MLREKPTRLTRPVIERMVLGTWGEHIKQNHGVSPIYRYIGNYMLMTIVEWFRILMKG